MNEFTFTKEALLNIILGKVHYRKCPCCDSDGRQYWDGNGMGVGPCPRPEWGEDYGEGLCDNCGGLGYILGTLIQ